MATAQEIADYFAENGVDPSWNSGTAQLINGEWTYTGAGATADPTARMQAIADKINAGTLSWGALDNSMAHILRSGGGNANTITGGATVGAGTLVNPGVTSNIGNMSETEKKNLIAEIKAAFPWAYEIGFGDEIEKLIIEGATMDQIVAQVRLTDGWKAMFPAFYREDGSKNFSTEAGYLQAVSDYRNVLKDYGVYDPAQDNPNNYVAWMNLQVDANELDERFQMYRGLERGTQELRDAFYVYGGLRVTVDDLYTAVVDPTAALDMEKQYNENVAATPLDYETFLTRTTEVATEHLVEQLGWLEENGYATAATISNVLGSTPDAARQFLDIIYTAAGNAAGTVGPMGLNELVTTYTYAMLGSAASEQGLVLPTQEKLERFVQAGVNRSRAMQAYGAYSVSQYGLAGMASRANVQQIDQSLFEEAMLLNQGSAQEVLNKAVGQEKSLGDAGGGFSTQLDKSGRLVQTGRS